MFMSVIIRLVDKFEPRMRSGRVCQCQSAPQSGASVARGRWSMEEDGAAGGRQGEGLETLGISVGFDGTSHQKSLTDSAGVLNSFPQTNIQWIGSCLSDQYLSTVPCNESTCLICR